MLLETGTEHYPHSAEHVAASNKAGPRWSELLEIDWRPRNFEIAFLLFTAIYVYLINLTHLPLSEMLAGVFVLKLVTITLSIYGLTVPIVLYRAAKHAYNYGKDSLRSKATLIGLLRPYYTLNFLILTLRRGFCLLGAIYFFLHLKHLVLWLNPSNYDALYWHLDQKLHFGVQPNIAAMHLIGPHHHMAVLIDWLYIKYFDYKIIVSMFFLLELYGRKLSDMYFLAYCTLWAVG
ncbi:MAG: hypothetical protein KDD69_13900, partial [Bdellovibrionales bacterium]|nr:hypothetical protein [Bdellovibrionales bacterium]